MKLCGICEELTKGDLCDKCKIKRQVMRKHIQKKLEEKRGK